MTKPIARRTIVAGLAGLTLGASAASFPALAQFGLRIGGTSDDENEDRGGFLNLNRLFSGVQSVFEGFTLDEKDEIRIGTNLFPKMVDRAGGPYGNRRAQRGIRNFSEELLKTSDRKNLPWEIVLVNNNTVNAWALPGGKIAIHKGLLRYTSSEDELAAVIAHEIGHVEMSHGLAQMKTEDFTKGMSNIARETILKQTNKGALNNLVLDQVEDRLMNTVTTGYSRDREFEADQHILKVFEKTGHDPARASNFFKSLLTVMPPGTKGTTSLFSTHPGTEDRIERIEEAARDLSRPDHGIQPARMEGFRTVKRYFPSRRKYRRHG